MAKKLLVFAAAIVFVVLAVVFIVDFESPELGKAVLEKATETTGAKLSVKRFRLNLIRGLELEGVEATSSLPGTIVDTRIDKLILGHRWLPLLSGRVAVDQLLIRRSELVLVERGAARKKKSAKGTKAKEGISRGPFGCEPCGWGERFRRTCPGARPRDLRDPYRGWIDPKGFDFPLFY